MTQENRFCSNCGAQLVPGDRFCGACGQPISSPAVAQPPPPPQFAPPPAANYYPPPAATNPYQQAPPAYQAPPVSAGGEPLVGVIPSVSRKKGMISVEGFNIIATPGRLIFAIMTNDMIKEAAKQAGQGQGFLGGMMAAATIGYTYYKRYLAMSPADALAENPQNFAIPLNSIRKVKVEAGKEIRTAGHSGPVRQHTYQPGKLELQTAGETYKFDLPNTSYDMAMETLRKVGLY